MVRAKFQCASEKTVAYNKNLKIYEFSRVFETQPGVDGNACEENHIFGKYTPNGKIEMTIDNPDVKFEVGKFYYVDFTEAEN